jgi:hypothetical protein
MRTEFQVDLEEIDETYRDRSALARERARQPLSP